MRVQAFKKKATTGFLLGALFLAAPSLAKAGGAAAAAPAAYPVALPAAPLPAASPASDPQALEMLRLEQPKLGKLKGVRPVEGTPSRRKWIALSMAEHGAAAFDAYSTREAIGRGAVEADPLMRPFAGSPSIYAAIQIAPLVLDYAARRMQRSHNPVLRKMWWLPQAGGTAMYLSSGVHNLGVAAKL